MNHPTLEIRIEIESYWHAGSGQGIKGDLDSMVVRDDHKLPYLPGRTLKGLIRDACLQAEGFGQLEAGTCEKLFGTRKDSQNTDPGKPGTLLFSSATLPQAESDYLSDNPEQSAQLFDSMAATKINDNGLADDGSLRITEVAIPMTLCARITMLPGAPADTREILDKAIPLLRSLGTARSRGFGRCLISVN